MVKSAPILVPDPGRRSARSVGRPRTLESGGNSLALILNLVRSGKATTRLSLQREAELGRAPVEDRLMSLRKLGLLADGQMGAPGRGRAPRHIRFVNEAGTILVAIIDRSSLSVALTDLSGRIVVEHHEAADLGDGPERIIERLTALFIWLLDERGGKDRVWAIGVALPEPFIADTNDGDAFGIASSDVLRAWRRLDLTSELMLRFSVPCWLRSGSQMMTIGEFKAGAGQGFADLLYIKLGHAISAGVISGGRLNRGALGSAGMLAHAPTGELSTIACHCGGRDCLGVHVSGEAIARAAKRAALDGGSRYLCEAMERNGGVTAIDVGHGAQLGDAFCAELLARCGRLVGQSVAPLVNLLNPAIVVLGGEAADPAEIILASVRESIYRRSHPLATRDLRIVRSQLGATAGLVGGALFVLDEIFAPSALAGWVAHGSPRRQPTFVASLEAAREASRKSARSGLQTV